MPYLQGTANFSEGVSALENDVELWKAVASYLNEKIAMLRIENDELRAQLDCR